MNMSIETTEQIQQAESTITPTHGHHHRNRANLNAILAPDLLPPAPPLFKDYEIQVALME